MRKKFPQNFFMCIVALNAVCEKCASNTWGLEGTFQSLFNTRPRLQVDLPVQHALLSSPQAQWGLAQTVPNPFQQQIPHTEDPATNEVEDVGDPSVQTTQVPPTTEIPITSSEHIPETSMANMTTPICALPGNTWCLDDPGYPR